MNATSANRLPLHFSPTLFTILITGVINNHPHTHYPCAKLLTGTNGYSNGYSKQNSTPNKKTQTPTFINV